MMGPTEARQPEERACTEAQDVVVETTTQTWAVVIVRPVWWCFKASGWFLSGEWMLACHSNGGAVILARSLFAASWIFVLASVLQCQLLSNDCHGHRLLIHTGDHSIPWFSAIFAGLYASLYSRFASQWSYLSDLYNRIKQTEAETEMSHDDERQLRIAEWKAAFLEDADELHLAGKPIFAAIIHAWVQDSRVRKAYSDHAPKGDAGMQSLRKRAAASAKRTNRIF